MSAELKAAITANKRLLALLDKDIAEASMVDPDIIGLDPDQAQPYTFTAVDGPDGDPGINVVGGGLGVNNPYYGLVRTDGDAAFVCTRMSAYVMITGLLGLSAPCFYDAPTAVAWYGLGVRLLDDTSSRRLSLVYNHQAMPWQGAIVPLDVIGQCSFGSIGGVTNPSECTFARNSTIRVEAFSTRMSSPTAMRVHVLFHGYKVYGG